MRLNEFVELGFIVQVDVPVMETREFNNSWAEIPLL